MRTYYINENGRVVLECPFVFRSYFKPEQIIIIDSKTYFVVRHNVLTTGDHEIYVKEKEIL